MAASYLMGRKHCEKRRNCSLRAISPFPTVFSKGLFPRGVKRCHCVGMGWIWWKWQKVLQTSRKHCGKVRNCLLQAISPFPTVSSVSDSSKLKDFAYNNLRYDENKKKNIGWARDWTTNLLLSSPEQPGLSYTVTQPYGLSNQKLCHIQIYKILPKKMMNVLENDWGNDDSG